MHMPSTADRERRFEDLVATVRPGVERYLRRRVDPATAEDVLGDVLLVLWRRVDEIPADEALPWCYGVARGCLANDRRRVRRRLALVARLGRERVPEPARDEDPALADALAAMSPADREVLTLWAWEDLAPREIAVVLGTTPNAVSIRLHRATARLREAYLKEQP
jgi:RNA polymerase sigma-70 factor (ECF subfamily)